MDLQFLDGQEVVVLWICEVKYLHPLLLGFAVAAIFNNLIDTYFIRYILNWISVYSRYVNFTNGIFDIAATVYYLSITAVFLFLSVRIYERRRYA